MTGMPFLRSLNDTAPQRDPSLRWPIHGLAYVAAFMGPLAAGPLIGLLTWDWLTIAVGLLMGIGITFLNAWLIDRFFDHRIAKYQRGLLKLGPRIVANIAAFGWALILSTLSALAPVLVLGSRVLTKIH